MSDEKGDGAAATESREPRDAADELPAPTAGGGVGDDPGAPGGMGGVRGGMPNPESRPNGGVSPIQDEGGGAGRD